MKQFGVMVMTMGVISLVLMAFGLNYALLGWIDGQGELMGYLGRAAIIALGFLIYKKSEY